MRVINSVVEFLVYSSLWIAFGAMLQVFQTSLLLTDSLQFNELPLFVFCSTLATYSLARVVGYSQLKDKKNPPKWAKNKVDLIFGIFISSSLFTVFLFTELAVIEVLVLFLCAILTIFYSLPLIPTATKRKRLRDFNYVKIVLISFIWAASTVILPVIRIDAINSYSLVFISWIFLEKLIFIFAITLPFDIRDYNFDKERNLETIPGKIGIKNTKMLGCICLFFLFVFLFFIYLIGNLNLIIISAFAISYFVAAIFTKYSSPNKNDLYYTFGVDGLLIFQFLVIYFASSIY